MPGRWELLGASHAKVDHIVPHAERSFIGANLAMRAGVAFGEIDQMLAGPNLKREISAAALAAQRPYAAASHRSFRYVLS
jgi:hypothetical protein